MYDLITPLVQILNDGTTNHRYGQGRLMSDTGMWYHYSGLSLLVAVLYHISRWIYSA